MNIEEILKKQKDFYRSGKTLPVKFRIQMLLKLYNLFADMPKPLALYIFSEDKKSIDRTIEKCQFGGGCVNDTIMQIALFIYEIN